MQAKRQEGKKERKKERKKGRRQERIIKERRLKAHTKQKERKKG